MSCCLRCLELWALAGLLGCGREPPVCPDGLTWLVGYRALSFGDSVTAWFEPGDPPVLRLPPGMEPTVIFEVSGTPIPLEYDELSADAARRLLRVQAPAELGGGVLRVEFGGCALSVPAHWRPNPAKDPALAPAEDLAKSGHVAEADALLAGLEQIPDLAVWARGRRAAHAATSGQLDRGIALFVDGARRAADLGHDTEASAHLRSAAFFALQRHGLIEAEGFVDHAEALVTHRYDPEGKTRLAYYRGRIENGRLRRWEAARLLHTATESALEIGDVESAIAYSMEQAGALWEQGNHRRAAQVVGDLPPSQRPRSRWYQARSLAWYRLEAMRACQIPRDFKEIQQTMTELAAHPPPPGGGPEAADAWVDATYAALLGGDARAAETSLDEARRLAAGTLNHPLFVDRLRGTLDLEQGAYGAAERVFLRLLSTGLHNDEAWRALYALGRLRATQGDRAGALALWRQAQGEVDARADQLGLQSGRSSHHADRSEVFDKSISLLLSEGRAHEAVELADRHRGPVLRTLEQSARLSALREEELGAWTRDLERQREAVQRRDEAVAAYERARQAAERLVAECSRLPLAEVAACQTRIK